MSEAVTPPDLLIFLHIPKTAGTSMRLFLWQTFGREKVFWHGEDGYLEDIVRERGLDYFRRFKAVGGHIMFSHNDLLKLPGRKLFAAVIRRPLDQVVSHFEFVSNHPEHPHYSKYSLEQTLETRGLFAHASRNIQCRYIANHGSCAEALNVVRSMPYVLGCHEHLDVFCDSIARTFQREKLPFPHENTQTSGYFEKHCTPRARELIADLTQEDEKLYRQVSQSGLLLGSHSC